MKLAPYFLYACYLFFSGNACKASDWGKTGHRVIGLVAQQHLTARTQEKVQYLLEGAPLAHVATFADEIRSDNSFDHMVPWHYVNIDQNLSYSESVKNPKGDIVTAMDHCVEVLQNPNSSFEDKAFYLKLLVHFIGDIHQPLHAGRKADAGGNDIEVRWFGKITNLHRLWDSDLIDYYKMSFTELAASLPKPSIIEHKKLIDVPRLDWVYESQELATKIYKNTPKKATLGYVYHYQHFDIVRKRLRAAGLRLAATLNAIFDPNQ